MKRLVLLLCVSLLVPSVSGCGCTLELRKYLEPSTITLAVGETAAPPRASVSGCSEPRRAVEIDTRTSQNPDTASVDADTGVITGVAPGGATIIARSIGQDGFTFSLDVTVVSS